MARKMRLGMVALTPEELQLVMEFEKEMSELERNAVPRARQVHNGLDPLPRIELSLVSYSRDMNPLRLGLNWTRNMPVGPQGG